ncbi:MAG: hypothetical protein CL797_06825 [Chromatiales bacterium]|jgi:hypothetical protein|nr:hypothetical protein [Chromatiales bacterium]
MLRNLIMGLLLANLLLYAWGRWIIAPDVADPLGYGDATEAQLVLIEPNEQAKALDSEPAQVGTRCFRLGPFSSAAAAGVISDRLSVRGLPVKRSSELGRIWVGHWVQVLDLPDLAAAREAVKALVFGGITDAYISNREPTIDISLGVFRGRRGAEDVIRLARTVGYTPETIDRYRDGIEFWLEVTAPADQSADLVAMNLGEAQIIRIEERQCGMDSVAVGGNDSLESRARENGSSEPLVVPE